MNIVWMVLIGLAAGWIAGLIMKREQGDWLRNLVLGVVGALVGGFLFGLLGLGPTSLLGQLIAAVVGACVVIALVGWLKGKR